jgi:hypothetical protein
MKNILEFKSHLVLETSYKSNDIGEHFNQMELRVHDHGKTGCIIWNYGVKAADEDETVIGLWFNGNKELEDYDGVYSLPKEAITLLRSNGYDLDEDMKETYPDENHEYEKELKEVDDAKTMKRCFPDGYYDWTME